MSVFSDRQLLILHRLLTIIRPAALGSLLKRLLRIRREPRQFSSGRFYIDPVSNFGATLLRDGEYEPEMAGTLSRFLKPGVTFLDVGANEGYFSVFASKIAGPSGRLVAVEPQRRLGPVLERNFELNGVRNVAVEHCAISNRQGKETMHLSPDMNTGSTSFVRSTRYALPTESVETITLSDLFDRHGIERADLMKMDIEGFEYEAILGSPELFENHRIKAIALELHPWILEKRHLNSADITAFLERCGYTVDRAAPTLAYVAPSAVAARV